MITDTDVKKLKKVFATKTDLKKFATKEDLKSFATKDDLKRFATKDDLKPLATRKWTLENFATKGETYLIRDELRKDISEVKTLVQETLTAVNKFSGKVADLDQENKMGAITTRRHGINIQELAEATGTTLSV